MVKHRNVWLDRVCSACTRLERPTHFIFRSQIKLFTKPRVRRVWLCNFHSIELVQRQQVLQHSLRPETTVRQRYTFVNPHDREDYNQQTVELAACITKVFVSNLMLLPSALAHGRFNLKLFSASLRTARRIHTFYCTYLYAPQFLLMFLFTQTSEDRAKCLGDDEFRCSKKKKSGGERFLQLTVTSAMRRNRNAEDSQCTRRKKKKKIFIDACRSELKNLRDFHMKSFLKIHQKSSPDENFTKTDFVVIAKVCLELSLPKNGKKLKSFTDLPPTRRIKNEFFIEILHSAEEARERS